MIPENSQNPRGDPASEILQERGQESLLWDRDETYYHVAQAGPVLVTGVPV